MKRYVYDFEFEAAKGPDKLEHFAFQIITNEPLSPPIDVIGIDNTGSGISYTNMVLSLSHEYEEESGNDV